MRIVIIGAGLAGPLLAQGLRPSGAELSIIERRRPSEHRSAGYRIHLDPQGDLALRACLEPASYQLALRTAGVEGSGWRVLDSELNVVHETLVGQPENPATDGRHLTVDRQTLREVLLDGLEDKIGYGVGFDRYEITGDGVRVGLDDGSSIDADLLVGADGSGSRVRTQRLPQLEVTELDRVDIFGRAPLSGALLPDIPPAALDGFAVVVSPDGRGMPLAAHRFANPPQACADELRPGLTMSADHDYLMWVITVPTAMLPSDGLPADLVPYAAGRISDLHPSLDRIVRASEPGSVHATTVRTSRRPEPWAPGPVTLIGDAAHPMVPAGIGAAVALADAARLAGELTEVAAGRLPLVDAVRGYELEMRRYAFDAVEASEKRMV